MKTLPVIPVKSTRTPVVRTLLRPAVPFVLIAVLAIVMAGAALVSNRSEAAAATDPVWVNDLNYGSIGGGFYFDFNSNQVWTGDRGWHFYSARPFRLTVPVLWVDFVSYGSAGGGFWLDPLSGQVWTSERGWHHFDPRPPRDSDGDGVPDVFDGCPLQPGPASNNGCPIPPPHDTDGDGVPDTLDSCPTQPGPASNHGCPVAPPTYDRDGDGTPDAVDYCPNQAGPAYNHGCPVMSGPDSDGDGIADIYDHCPNQPGPASNFGCPLVSNYGFVNITVDRGNGSFYRPGEPIRICYSVSMPGQVQIVDYTPDGLQHTLLSGMDDGRGGCFNAVVSLPYGHERIVIFAFGNQFQNFYPYQNPYPGATAQAEASFNVIP